MEKLTSLCVYCGSSSGRIDAYAAAARALAQAMVERGIRLVYGGASVGIMGAVADEVLRLGGKAVGDRKSTRLNSSHSRASRMPSSA